MKYWAWLIMALTFPAWGADIRVAVAANFNGTLQQLAERYQTEFGHTLRISSASSGALFTQIVNGAPFDVFLSADQQRPARLVEQGYAVPGTAFPYAFGVPVLWSALPDFIDAEASVLTNTSFRFLAVAEPRNAPYGLAAQQVLTALDLWDTLHEERRIVTGSSVGQTHSQVATGAAELGFVALAQVTTDEGIVGSYWLPPETWYDPIAQGAVLLRSAEQNASAQHFLHWLESDEWVQKTLITAGYRVSLSGQ